MCIFKAKQFIPVEMAEGMYMKIDMDISKLMVPVILPLGMYLVFGSVAAGAALIVLSVLYIIAWFVKEEK